MRKIIERIDDGLQEDWICMFAFVSFCALLIIGFFTWVVWATQGSVDVPMVQRFVVVPASVLAISLLLAFIMGESDA